MARLCAWLAWISVIGITFLSGARLGLLAGFLLAAALSDIATRKIPNRLILIGIAAGWLAQAFLPDGEGVISALKGMVFGFGLFLPLYLVRVMGAGDVKLMAMVGCFSGSPAILGIALCSVLAGGVLSLVLALKMQVFRQMLGNVKTMLFASLNPATKQPIRVEMAASRSVGTLPYALAIAAGTVIYFIWQSF